MNSQTLVNKRHRKYHLAIAVAATLCFAGAVEAAQNWNYTYNSTGQVLTANGPRTDVSDITTYTYDASGNVASITNPLGQVVQLQNYNGRGQPGKIIDANGVETLLTYHVRGWLLTTTVKDPADNPALDATTSYDYDNVGQVISITTPDGVVLNYEYDGAHRLVAISNTLNERIEYTLDAAGNRTNEDIKSATGEITKTLSRTYDELSRLLQVIGASNQTTSYIYDTNGNVITLTDGNSNQTSQSYDALDQLVNESAPLNSSATYSYDARGNITSVTDPKGLVTHYSYDGFDNLIQQESPDTGITTYRYDEANNRISQTDANGNTTTFTYDALNRLTSISYPNSALNVIYGYDAGTNGKGRLTSITDASGATVLEYDHRGNLIGQATDVGQATYSLQYSYHLSNRLSIIAYPSGRTVDYSYDTAGRLSGVTTTLDTTTQTLASNLDYQPFGPLNQLDYGNGIQLSQSFDLDYRLSELTHGAVKNSQYSYDNNSNITAIDDNLYAPKSQNFNYDALNRLTNATGAYGTLSYTYDANGNRLTYTDSTGVDSYTYDANSHRLLSTNDWDYQYDNNGNRIAKLLKDGSGDGLLYRYDDHSRLVEVIERETITTGKGKNTTTTQTDTTVATYTYNAYGQRVTKVTSSETTYYVYSLSGQLLAEMDQAGNPLREYIYLNGQPLAVAENTLSQNPPPAGQEHIFDNDDPETTSTGNWSSESSNKAYNGNYRLSDNNGSSYRWTPASLNAGTYEVYARWPGVKQHNKTAQYSIVHNGQSSSRNQDQSANGNQWVLLGSYAFSGGGSEYIELSDAGGKTAADAIRLVEQPAPPPPTITSTFYFVHNDHLGTPQVITDANQNIVWGADYRPFGEVSTYINTIANNLRFPGQYFDAESNLHYNYFRDYDPSLGRYLQSDPIGLQGGLNTYGYVLQDPIRYTDPTGQYAIPYPWLIPILNEIVKGIAAGLGISMLMDDINDDSGDDSADDSEQCEEDDDDDCNERLSDWQLAANGINAHELKHEYLGKTASVKYYELCKCKGGTVAIRLKGCKGPSMRTWAKVR